jgi:putative transposase
MYVTLYYGRSFRVFNVIDESNGEMLVIEINPSLPTAHVVRVMKHLDEIVSLPKPIRLDSGGVLRSAIFASWFEEKDI